MTEEDKRKKDMNQRRAIVFYKRETKVHVTMISGTFYNGYVTEVSEDFFFLNDQKLGEKIIFFCELKQPIEIWKEKEEKLEYG